MGPFLDSLGGDGSGLREDANAQILHRGMPSGGFSAVRVPCPWIVSCSRSPPMAGLVTLFMDKERERICWCPPGAAELVPDPIYALNVHEIIEVRGGHCVWGELGGLGRQFISEVLRSKAKRELNRIRGVSDFRRDVYLEQNIHAWVLHGHRCVRHFVFDFYSLNTSRREDWAKE